MRPIRRNRPRSRKSPTSTKKRPRRWPRTTRRNVRRSHAGHRRRRVGHRGQRLGRRRRQAEVQRGEPRRGGRPSMKDAGAGEFLGPYSSGVTSLEQIAPAFIEMAHSIVWASVATVDANGHPRSRILHPIWEWDGTDLLRLDRHRAEPGEEGPPGRPPGDVAELLDRPPTTPAAPSAWSSGTSTTKPAGRSGTSSPTRPRPWATTPDIIPHVGGRADIRRVRRVAAEPLPAAGDARHGHDERRRGDSCWTMR